MKRMRAFPAVFSVCIILLNSCGGGQQETVDQEMERDQPAHFATTPIETEDPEKLAALKKYVMEQGNLIAVQSQQALGAKLKEAIAGGGVQGALKYCNLNAHSLIDSLSRLHKVKIKRASLRLRNPGDAPDEQEREIIEEIQKAMTKGGTVNAKVVFMDDDVLFAKPIILNSGLCLNCHGKVGEELTAENYELIKQLYPEDDAANHKIGDLRGIWSIRFNRSYLEQVL